MESSAPFALKHKIECNLNPRTYMVYISTYEYIYIYISPYSHIAMGQKLKCAAAEGLVGPIH